MMNDRSAIDPGICPLCGRPNGCAMAAGGDGQVCWCARVTIDARVLERIPVEQRGVACVCARCAAGALDAG